MEQVDFISPVHGLLVGYARTSTADQVAGLEAQDREIRSAGATKIFKEHASGKDAQRPQLQAALTYLREGDILVITKIDRLARSISDFLRIVDELEEKNVGLRILDFAGRRIDTKSAADRLILVMFAGFAQFERDLMLERQKIGIVRAREEGRYAGRKPTARMKADDIRALWMEGMSAKEIAEKLEVSRSSVYAICQETPARSAEITRVWKRKRREAGKRALQPVATPQAR